MEKKAKTRTPEPLKSPRLTTKTSSVKLSVKKPQPQSLSVDDGDAADAGNLRSKPPTPGSFPKAKRATPKDAIQRSKSPQPTPVSRYATKTTPRKTPTPMSLRMTPVVGVSVSTATPKDTPVRRSSKEIASARSKSPEIHAADKLKVAIRIRPYNHREKRDKNNDPVSIKEKTVTVNQEDKCQSFTFDDCFWSEDSQHPQWASQRIVYETLGQPLLLQAMQGYNVSLLAYGQTGSGKSYSMMGLPVTQEDGITLSPTAGITPRFVKDLFERLEDDRDKPLDYKYFVEISFCEIYNERMQDLLSDEGATLRVREHPVDGPFIENLRVASVASFEALMHLLNVGNRRRATASTNMNDTSSRSHSIFTVHLKQAWVEDDDTEETRFSRMHFVDLAGSEKLGSTDHSDRWKEGVSINKSLLTLGKVITGLAEGVHTPYRDSVLTFILRESLGGNAKTAFLATVSPSHQHIEETLATLRYARGASGIVNKPIINEEAAAKQIKKLKEQIARLTSRHLSPHPTPDSGGAQEEIAYLKNELVKKEEMLRRVNRIWDARLQEERAKNVYPEMKSVGFPRLVKLHDDPQFSGKIAYALPSEGERLTVCRGNGQNRDDTIFLPGVQIGTPHCVISHNGVNFLIKPVESWKTHVNGEEVHRSQMLRAGDCVVLGLQHYLWLQQEECDLPDFEDIRQLLWKRQEEKLAKELTQQYSQKCEELKNKATALAEQLKETEKQLQQEQELRGFMKGMEEIEAPSFNDSADEELTQIRNMQRMFQQSIENIEEVTGRQGPPIKQMKGKMIKETNEIFRRLQEGGEKIAERLEIVGADGVTIKPGQLFSMVDEANQLVNGLKPKLCFSLEYSPDSNVTVKVTQIDHGTATFWSTQTFHANLLKLRSQEIQGRSVGFMLGMSSQWVLSCKSSVGQAVYKSMNRVHRRLTDSWDVKRQYSSTSALPLVADKIGMTDETFASMDQLMLSSESITKHNSLVDSLLETMFQLLNALDSFKTSTLLDKESLISWEHQLVLCCSHGSRLGVKLDSIRFQSGKYEDLEKVSELGTTIRHLLGLICQNIQLRVLANLSEYVDQCSEAVKKLVYHAGALCVHTNVVPEIIQRNKLSNVLKDGVKDGVLSALTSVSEKAFRTSKYSELTVTSVIDNVQVTGRAHNQAMLDVLGMAHELAVAIAMFCKDCPNHLGSDSNLELAILLGHSALLLEKDVEKLAAFTHGIYEGDQFSKVHLMILCHDISSRISEIFPCKMDGRPSVLSLSFVDEVFAAKASSLSYITKDIVSACTRLAGAAEKFYGMKNDVNQSTFNQTATP